MDLAHLADDAGLNPLVRQPRAFGGVPLIAHLRGDAGRVRGLGQLAAFVQRVRERLLAIDVLAGANRGHRGHGVNVIGRADRDGVDVLRLLVEHLAKILVAPRLRKRAETSRPPRCSSTSHSATMLAPFVACVAMSPPPMPPAPMPATFTRSLGGTNPAPPSTCRGTIVKPRAMPPRRGQKLSSQGACRARGRFVLAHFRGVDHGGFLCTGGLLGRALAAGKTHRTAAVDELTMQQAPSPPREQVML